MDDMILQISGSIDYPTQIIGTVFILFMLGMLIAGYIEEGNKLKEMEEEDAEHERKKKENNNPLRKV